MNNNIVDNTNNISNTNVNSASSEVPVVQPITPESVSSTVQNAVPVGNVEVQPQPVSSSNTSSNVNGNLPVVNPEAMGLSRTEVPISSTNNNTEDVTDIGMNGGDNTNVLPEQKLKEVEINYTPSSKFKTFLLILFFIAMLAFIIFLPEITSFVNLYTSGDYKKVDEKIVTGRLKCTYDTSTANLDKKYNLTFTFTDNKLEKTDFVITTRGDITLDADTMDGLAATCKHLKENVEDIAGVSVGCEYIEGKLTEKQSFDLQKVSKEDVDSAFVEAGGNNPEYEYGQDMDRIEKNMLAAGYSCKREK